MSRRISTNGNKITAGEWLISSHKYTSDTHTHTHAQRNLASTLRIFFTCSASRTEGEIRHPDVPTHEHWPAPLLARSAARRRSAVWCYLVIVFTGTAGVGQRWPPWKQRVCLLLMHQTKPCVCVCVCLCCLRVFTCPKKGPSQQESRAGEANPLLKGLRCLSGWICNLECDVLSSSPQLGANKRQNSGGCWSHVVGSPLFTPPKAPQHLKGFRQINI